MDTRTAPELEAGRPGHGINCDSCAAPVALARAPALPPDAALFRIGEMDCASEEAEIRRALESVPGIRSLSFNLTARTLAITAPDDVLPKAVEAITLAGFKPEAVPRAGAAGKAEAEDMEHGIGAGMVRLAIALLLALAAELIELFAPGTVLTKGTGMALALGAIALAGTQTYAKGFSALRRGKLNINGLMSVAVTGAFLIGEWPEAAMVMALYAIAELMEARAVDRARNAIRSLMDLSPDEALVRQADGRWEAVPVADVPLDAVVRVRPGERVPLDGVVVRGNSAINQAPVTGESIPVEKEPGDQVFAGTINETAELEFRVTAAASNTMLARVIHAVEEAQGSRSQTQRFVDRFAAIYTPAVFVLALGVAVLAPWLMDWTWREAIYKALVLLVIACPCALVISTPVTVVSALAAAARRGILIKGGVYLENARRLRAIALDKTGTITEGRPTLVEHKVLLGAMPIALERAAGLAARSDHPVSKAIAAGLSVRPRSLLRRSAVLSSTLEHRMHPRRRTKVRARQVLMAAILAGAAAGLSAQSATPSTQASPGVSNLKELFEAAWARQPEAQALQARRDAAQAQRRAAAAWTPEPPAFESSYKTDRLTRNDGARELEVAIAVPLWLPGERRSSAALADAEAAAVESRANAARLRLAAEVREAWWNWHRTGVEVDIARGQLDSARRLADDVARRVKSGELARTDQHQAEGAVAAAEAAVAQSEAAAAAALEQLKALAGGVPIIASAATASPPEPEPVAGDMEVHPALAELQGRSTLAERAAALVAAQSRPNPELTVATTRERGAAGERYGQAVTLAVRIPFGGGSRHDGRVANARAEAAEAQAQLASERARLQAEREAAVARVNAARAQLSAAERRAALARETRGFFERSFRLGETDLPTRLRIESEAAEAERQAARSRVELAAAISAWRQALGLPPQ